MSIQPSLTWSSYALSHIGNVRKVNEDAYLEKPDIGLWAVADGMGGHTAGDEASRLIVTTLDTVEPQESLRTFATEVERLLQHANQELVSFSARSGQISGSTVVILLTQEDRCAYLWAGDSRAYLFRENMLTQLTTDHTQAEVYVQMGLMTRGEAVGHPAVNWVTCAIGLCEELRIERGAMEVKPGDRYLLCSDGLPKYVSHPELADFLAADSAPEAAQKLVTVALSRGGADNVTVIVIDIHKASPEQPSRIDAS